MLGVKPISKPAIRTEEDSTSANTPGTDSLQEVLSPTDMIKPKLVNIDAMNIEISNNNDGVC